MLHKLANFEVIVRRAHLFTDAGDENAQTEHPFALRNIHPDFPSDVQRLFDNGYYAQATFEALKFIDEEVQRISGDSDFGRSLMFKVFGGSPPKVALNPGMTESERNEQEGFKFLFGGAITGIRNPRGHSTGINDDPDSCLDHLTFASMLLRRLDSAGVR